MASDDLIIPAKGSRAVLRVFVVRHGQTDCNVQGIMQGHLDTPLNDVGRQQALLVGQALKDTQFDAAFSSDSDRAQATAKAIVDIQEGLTLQTTELLRERDMGDLTGMKWPVTRKEGDGIRPETVETSASMRNRVVKFMEETLVPMIPESGERNVLVTSHGAMIATFVQLLLAPHGPYRFEAAPTIPDPMGSCWNTSITEFLVWPSKTPSKSSVQGMVLRWSDISHLEAEGGDRVETTDAKAI